MIQNMTSPPPHCFGSIASILENQRTRNYYDTLQEVQETHGVGKGWADLFKFLFEVVPGP